MQWGALSRVFFEVIINCFRLEIRTIVIGPQGPSKYFSSTLGIYVIKIFVKLDS